MKRTYLKIIFTVTISVLLAVTYANAEPGTEEAAFLKIDAATRPVAMGGAFVGVANDVNSVFWNPAGLTQMEKRELTGMYNAWLSGINYGSGAYSQPIGKNAAVAISGIYLQSEIERRLDDTEEADSVFNAYSYAIGLSASYALMPKMFSLGGTVKYLGQNFDVAESSAIGADLGALVKLSNLQVGASVQNITLNTSNDYNQDLSLPFSFRVGAGLQFQQDSIISAELNKIGEADMTYHIGLEKWFRKVLAIRAGYCIGSNDNPKNGLSAGFGLRAYGTKPLEKMNFQMDYAYVPDSDGMGDTHRVSMIVRF
jgi:hypothetical protein